MRRVLILTNTVQLGGADRQAVYLADGLQRKGWEVRIVALSPLGPMGVEARARGLRLSSLDVEGLRGLPWVAASIVRDLRRWRPHVLHCLMFHANILGRIARIPSHVPVVISSVRSLNEGARWRAGVYRLTDGLADVTTQVSLEGVRRYVAIGAVPESKIAFMPNGVDLRRFHRRRNACAELREELGLGGEFAWLAVGRLHPSKDYPSLLEAFRRLRATQPGAVLLIVGDGQLRGDLESRAAAAGVSEEVRFLGARSDVADLMNAVDAYVMSSAWEGMPNALLEASASELPLVATNVAGNADVVVDGETGFLVPPRDAEALSGAMRRLMRLPHADRRSMGAAGRARVEAKYDIERAVDRWEALYVELLARKHVDVRRT
jgi:glycosyltransferase involved in cell wall biosynthesis